MSSRLVLCAIMALPLAAVIACRTTDSSVQQDESAGDAWRRIQAERQAARDGFFAEQKAALHAFLNTPMGYQGTPAIIIGLLADVMPDLWGPDAVADGTGLTALVGDFPAALHQGPARNGPFSIVAFSCATCHVGRVRVNGEEQLILGAPNTRIDTAGFRNKLWKTVNDPRFNAAAFRDALARKRQGWLFGDAGLEREAKETAAFKADAAELLEKTKAQIDRTRASLHRVLGSYTYRDDPALLDGGVPGSVDAFGYAVASQLMPPDAASLAPDELASAQRALLPTAPPMVDIMSIWRQDKRKLAQWDGSIQAKLIRNLGAELGVIGSPALVNLDNARLLTPFAASMPAPVYPFAVDLAKAARGQRIYEQTCAVCHTRERFVGLDTLGTDPNRARSLTAKAREGLIAALAAACSDETLTDCQAPDEQILVDRLAAPGYVSLPHDGLWARAPYLHNGSIPTLYHLLVPGERPSTFKRGGSGYDQEKVGFDWTREGVDFTTSRSGFASSGHSDKDIFFGGRDFAIEVQAREDLLEYLKTL
jgi:mono/diheme cytochrome c family protein